MTSSIRTVQLNALRAIRAEVLEFIACAPTQFSKAMIMRPSGNSIMPRAAQHENNTSAIKTYGIGLINETARAFFVNGKIVTQEEAWEGSRYGYQPNYPGDSTGCTLLFSRTTRYSVTQGIAEPVHHDRILTESELGIKKKQIKMY
ncbi:hypothetical protein V496_04340 [Pseudogymnoascus sp. VKM F-4515 (FW-2607)]|nr:hypothetical protein V496_04340 [Pseudogymnoascus sp. VKM F-4515 (FW-2607)]